MSGVPVPTDTKSKRFKRLLFSGFVLFCALYYFSLQSLAQQASGTVLASYISLIPSVLAPIGCYLAFKHVQKSPTREKRFWLYLMLAAALFLLGRLTWSYITITAGSTMLAAPSVVDYLQLGGYAFLYLTLFSMARLSDAFSMARIRYVLDTIVITLIAATFVWFFLLKPLYSIDIATTLAETIVKSIYPVADLGILFGLTFLLFGLKTLRWRAWETFTAIGLLAVSAPNLIFDYLATVNIGAHSTLLAHATATTWFIASFCWFVAGLQRLTIDQDHIEKQLLSPGRFGIRWPDVGVPLFVVIMMPVFLYAAHFLSGSALDFWIFMGAASTLAIVTVTRSGLVIFENSRLFSRSVTDYATNVYNHRYFKNRLREEIDRATRYNFRVSVAIFDIDDFGRTNDIHGHVIGDRILRDVADKISSVSRISDVVCRIGGDEFALILPNANSLEAHNLAARLQKEIRIMAGLTQIQLSISGGIATFPDHALEASELQRKADVALYWTKFHGKEQVIIYDPDVVEALNAEERAKRAEEASYLSTVHALADAVDARDFDTRYHAKHVASLVTLLGIKMGFSTPKVRMLEIAGLLHDVGKIGISEAIIKKPGPLTYEERKKVEEHPRLGERILTSSTFTEILSWVLSHHEHWDGNGYPQGLKGEDIPIEARMLAVCDAYDAMTSERPYRPAQSLEATVQELKKCRGTQFDPDIVDRFLEILGQVEHTMAANE